MKLLKNIALLPFLLLSMSFTPNNDTEEEIRYEVIIKSSSSELNFSPSGYFTLDNIFEYDDFWMWLTGSLLNQPKVDMHTSRLIVLSGSGTIDKITISYGNINIYTTTKVATNQCGYYTMRGTTYVEPPPFRVIKIGYNGSPVRIFDQRIQEEAKYTSY